MADDDPTNSSLKPQHSVERAAELSAGLSSALASDVSYQQMNDAKMRGVSAMVGWDQFHGMVLTAHLKPVNLRADPIDELARGIPRAKKLEKERQRGMEQYATGSTGKEGMSAAQEEDNREFLRALDLQVPTNAHELARDWKRLAADPAAAASIEQMRYRYILTLPLRSATQLLKGGLPLDIIAEMFAAVHTHWTAADDEDEAATTAEAQSDPAVAEPAAAASADPAAASSASLPSPSSVCHVLLLLDALSAMSSFSIALFSLTPDDKLRLSDILTIAAQTIASAEWTEWQQQREQAEKDTAAVDAAAAAVAAVSISASAASSVPAPASTPTPAAVRTDLDHSKARGNMLLSGPSGPAPRSAATAASAKAAPAAPVQFNQALVDKLRAKYKLPTA